MFVASAFIHNYSIMYCQPHVLNQSIYISLYNRTLTWHAIIAVYKMPVQNEMYSSKSLRFSKSKGFLSITLSSFKGGLGRG